MNNIDLKVFASKAKQNELSDFPDVERGWGITEKQDYNPTMQQFNGAFNRVDKNILSVIKNGISPWQETLAYPTGAVVQQNGVLYQAIRDALGQSPVNNLGTYWKTVIPPPTAAATENKTGVVKISSDPNSNHDDVAASTSLMHATIDAAKKQAFPLGAIIAFDKSVTQPYGFLKCDGSTFDADVFPGLYKARGNSNVLPDLNSSDVGMMAWFPVDNVPSGWMAYDAFVDLWTIDKPTATQKYPALSALLGSATLSKVDDRYLRNASGSLHIGQLLDDEFKNHGHKLYSRWPGNSDWSTLGFDGRVPSLNVGSIVMDVADNDSANNGWVNPRPNTPATTGGEETRPKTLVLKLCIRVLEDKNSLNYWIRAFGEITPPGLFDTSRAAQVLQNVIAEKQDLQARFASLVESNAHALEEAINNSKEQINLSMVATILQVMNNKNQEKVVFSGNQASEQTIDLSSDLPENAFNASVMIEYSIKVRDYESVLGSTYKYAKDEQRAHSFLIYADATQSFDDSKSVPLKRYGFYPGGMQQYDIYDVMSMSYNPSTHILTITPKNGSVITKVATYGFFNKD